MNRWQKVYEWAVKYKYIIIVLIFAPWITFFGNNSLKELYLIDKRKNQLIKTKNDLQQKIIINNKKYKELLQSDDEIERFARENFFFKADNEDIFVIKEQKYQENN